MKPISLLFLSLEANESVCGHDDDTALGVSDVRTLVPLSLVLSEPEEAPEPESADRAARGAAGLPLAHPHHTWTRMDLF